MKNRWLGFKLLVKILSAWSLWIFWMKGGRSNLEDSWPLDTKGGAKWLGRYCAKECLSFHANKESFHVFQLQMECCCSNFQVRLKLWPVCSIRLLAIVYCSKSQLILLHCQTKEANIECLNGNAAKNCDG